MRIWNGRRHFKTNGLGAWYLFAAKTAHNCAIDLLRTESPSVPLSQFEDLPGDEEFLDKVSILARNRQSLFETADEALLRIDPSISSAERVRRIFAAQLHYLHASTPKEILDIVSSGTKVSTKDLDAWILDPATLRALAVHHLYQGNETLFETVVGISPTECEERLRAGQVHGEWSLLELRIAILRLRNGLLQEKISQILPEAIPSVQANVVEKCRERYPFAALARELKFALRGKADLMTDQDVWKRLAFQYYVVDELPHKQIVERLAPAAAVFEVHIDEQLLHNWFSVGRLFLQIQKYVRKST